jgi:glutamate 5-kinase
VTADDPLLSIRAGAGGSGRGSGGMASKLSAARIASWSGVRTVIARASREGVLGDAVNGVAVGTTFAGHDRRLPARKLWIAFAAEVKGAIVVDDGARRALTQRGTSLLPAGMREVAGEFVQGDTVDVVGPDREVFARGMVFATSSQLRGAVGRQTSELPDDMTDEVIHRDDLVVL